MIDELFRFAVSKLQFLSDEKYLQAAYFVNTKKRLSFSNPQTFTEKLQWLKVNERTPTHSICADKYLVRNYIAKVIGNELLIPMVGYYNKIEDVDFSTLPDKFIIKGTHGSGMNTLVLSKSDCNWPKTVKYFKSVLNENYYCRGREFQYRNLKPGIIIEELLLDKNGNIPNDYKFHCFVKPNGSHDIIIQIDNNRFGDHNQVFLTQDWERLDLSFGYTNPSEFPERPYNLNSMITIAKKLATGFSYVRVDLYSLKQQIFFGELTFHHLGGMKIPNGNWDERLGKMIHIPLFKN